MTYVAYRGKGIRILAAEDLAKADVEGFKKTSFPRNEAVEVEDAVAEALTFDPELFGKFEVVDGPEVEEKAAKKSAKEAKNAEKVSDSEPAATGNISKTPSKN